MTLSQLKVFVLVTRLGSVKAAAASLGVSEPAVSQALTALRAHLGDPLLVRNGASMELTSAGQRVVTYASQIVGLAVEAEAAARAGTDTPDLLRVVVTPTLADSVGPAILKAFSDRVGRVEITLSIANLREMAALVQEHLADVAIGEPLRDGIDGLHLTPLLRWRLLLIASSNHPHANRVLPVSVLARETWCVDASGIDQSSVVGGLLARLQVPQERTRVFPNTAAAIDAASRGAGIAPVVEHLLRDDLAKANLCRLNVAGLPNEATWCAYTRSPTRRSPIASRFVRFATTPEGVHELRNAGSGVPAARFRPPVYVTIWS